MKFAVFARFIRLAGTTAAMLLMATTVRADFIPASWEQFIDFNPDIDIPPAHTYQHDLTTDGFRPLEDILLSFDLTVDIYDDSTQFWDGFEIALVDLPGILGDRVFLDLSGSEFGGWSLLGAIELNLYGTLQVSIDSMEFGLREPRQGDFMLASSHLIGYGAQRRIPEPGTLALLGVGLAGIGLTAMRRRRT